MYQAELNGWILYLEGSTDLAVLIAFADKLNHPAHEALERPFVIYVANDSSKVQRQSVKAIEAAQQSLGRDIWSPDIKATDEVLDPIFRDFFGRMNEPLLFRKTDYHRLVRFMNVDQLDSEITEKLDRIFEVSKLAKQQDD